MQKDYIKIIASRISTQEDLLGLLNHIKLDEMRNLCLDEGKFYPFTMKQLKFYCNPSQPYRYRHFNIQKKSGGIRQISAPINKTFTMILQSVNEMFKAIYTPSDYAMGFVEKRSVVTNANVHKAQNYVFNIDLKDFFSSIEQFQVRKRLQSDPFNFPITIAGILADLCTVREKRKDADGKDIYAYILPQGAPTSPIITNMICDVLDRRLAGVAKRFGLNYTRYADDITFSSNHYVYAKNREFRNELVRVIEGQGFRINEKKTRLQKHGSRQEVTGIIVSDKLNVTKKYVREIRSLLYIWEKYGYSDAYKRFYPKYKAEKGHVKKGHPGLLNVLEGKLLYLKMVKGDSDSVFVKLNSKLKKLCERDNRIFSNSKIVAP